MDSLFEVGDIVYVQGKVITVEEQEDDVRYSVITSIAKFFCTESKDKIRRSADSQNMLKKSFEEGKESYHDVLTKILNMTDEQREEVFGNSNIAKIIGAYDTGNEIIELYSKWVKRMNVMVSDIVTYKPKDSALAYDCIVLSVMVEGPNGTMINCDDLTEAQQADPIILSSKILSMYDPENKIFFHGVSIHNIDPVGKRVNAHAYLDDMKREFEEVMNEDQSLTGVNIKKVESKNDIDYDDYYNEDDIET